MAHKSLPKDIVAKQRYQTDDELKVVVNVTFENNPSNVEEHQHVSLNMALHNNNY